MKKRLSIIALAATAVVSVATAFIAGVHVGASESLLLRSTSEAALLVGELRALREAKYSELIGKKELDLDTQVLFYSKLQTEGHPWLLWPLSESFEHERYLRTVAQYRKQFPVVMTSVVAQGQGEYARELKATAELINRTTEDIIRGYGR